MKNPINHTSNIYLNVMEELVYEEIEKQFNAFPSSRIAYISKIEVATYALNRLPSLYASSEKGKHQQTLIGKQQYKKHIAIAVRQGIAAVQRDPLRVSTPLISEITAKYQIAETALKELQCFLDSRNLTNYQKLSWSNLVSMVQYGFDKIIKTNTLQTLSPPVAQSLEEEDSWFKHRRYYTDKSDRSA